MAEPLSIEQVKVQLNISEADTSHDAWIQDNIQPAREYVEGRSDHILVQRAFTEYRSCFGSFIELTRRPIVEVTEVAYLDVNGVAATYAGFVTNLTGQQARVFPGLNDRFPSMQANTSASITYSAGFVPGDEPATLLLAMKQLLAHWFVNRETAGANLAEVPFTVNDLCDQKRGIVL